MDVKKNVNSQINLIFVGAFHPKTFYKMKIFNILLTINTYYLIIFMIDLRKMNALFQIKRLYKRENVIKLKLGKVQP